MDAADGVEGVTVLLCAFDEDAAGVEGVDADLAGGVDDAAVTHTDAYVDDATLGVVEEGEVVALDVAGADLDTAGGLLRGIAGKPDIVGLEAYLREAGAVDAAGGTAAPEVGGAQEETLGKVGGGVEGGVLLVVDPSLVAIVVASHPRPFLLTLNDFDGVAQDKLVDHLGAVAGFGPHGHC